MSPPDAHCQRVSILLHIVLASVQMLFVGPYRGRRADNHSTTCSLTRSSSSVFTLDRLPRRPGCSRRRPSWAVSCWARRLLHGTSCSTAGSCVSAVWRHGHCVTFPLTMPSNC